MSREIVVILVLWCDLTQEPHYVHDLGIGPSIFQLWNGIPICCEYLYHYVVQRPAHILDTQMVSNVWCWIAPIYLRTFEEYIDQPCFEGLVIHLWNC